MDDVEVECPMKQQPVPLMSVNSAQDLYGDLKDLEITGDLALNSWLLRVSKEMWNSWSAIRTDDQDEIQLGVMRVNGDATNIDLLLNSHLSINEDFPYEYELDVTNHDTDNTFIFTESTEPTHPRLIKRARSAIEGDARDMQRTHQVQSKRTRLAAHVKHELSCRELDTQRSRELLAKRVQRRGREVNILNEGVGGSRLAEGNLGILKNFVKANTPAKRRGLEERAVRMSETELTTAIFESFKEFQYWPIKSLRIRLHQPESYLKNELKKYAILVKSGPFNGKWRLKDEWKATAQITDQVAEVPGPGNSMDEPSGSSEIEDVDFEDSLGDSGSDIDAPIPNKDG